MSLSLIEVANWAQILSLPLMIVLWLFTREQLARFWKKAFKLLTTVFFFVTTIGLWRVGLFAWLSMSITWPLWAMILLSLSALAIKTLLNGLFSLFSADSEYLRYTRAVIHDVVWHWQYVAGKIDDNSLYAVCPDNQCSCRLDPQRLSLSMYNDDVTLVCNHCGLKKDFHISFAELKHRTILEIDRRLRTGEYKTELSERR